VAAVKVLNPTTTIIMPSHMKPATLPTSIESVLRQTRQDFVLVIIDSGEWMLPGREVPEMQRIYETYSRHPLIEWYTLGELPGLIDRRCPIAYIPNLVARMPGLLRGHFVAFMTDDDLYKPTYIEKMIGYLDDYEDVWAVYCGQDRVWLQDDGATVEAGPTLYADRVRNEGEIVGQVDLLQMVVRTFVLQQLPFDERPEDALCRIADGRWMDSVARTFGPVPNIPDILVTHRYSSAQTYG
jgi:hypothetical protein